MEMLLQDLRYAGRALVRTPGLSIVIVISIALGVAANATVFSVANGLLWGVLPVKDPGRMVMFSGRPIVLLSRLSGLHGGGKPAMCLRVAWRHTFL